MIFTQTGSQSLKGVSIIDELDPITVANIAFENELERSFLLMSEGLLDRFKILGVVLNYLSDERSNQYMVTFQCVFFSLLWDWKKNPLEMK